MHNFQHNNQAGLSKKGLTKSKVSGIFILFFKWCCSQKIFISWVELLSGSLSRVIPIERDLEKGIFRLEIGL